MLCTCISMHTIGKVFVSLRFPDGALRCPGTQVYILKRKKSHRLSVLYIYTCTWEGRGWEHVGVCLPPRSWQLIAPRARSRSLSGLSSTLERAPERRPSSRVATPRRPADSYRLAALYRLAAERRSNSTPNDNLASVLPWMASIPDRRFVQQRTVQTSLVFLRAKPLKSAELAPFHIARQPSRSQIKEGVIT